MGVDATIDITPEERQTVLALLQRHLPGTAAWVYGSRAKWTSTPTSDLDLVVFATPEQQPQVGDLREAFEESNLPFRVDLFVWDDVPESFRQRIEADKAPLVCQEAGDGSTVRVAATGRRDPDGLRIRRFEELLDEPVRNGIYKSKEHHGDGVKIVNMGELFAHPRLRAVPMRRVRLSESEIERFSVTRGDLLFARRSLVAEGAGKCSVVLDVDEPTAFESSIIRARPAAAISDPLYLYYFFSSPPGLHRLDTIRRQVAVAGITGRDLSGLEIPSPPLSEQRAIAHILGTLDDKIELNRRMNATLEALAQALFRSWFVDFDPVRAKMEGRDIGLPTDIADLFPDRLVGSELGETPEGWSVGTLGDVAEPSGTGVDPTSVDRDTPYIGLEHMPRCSVALTDWGSAGSVSSNKSGFSKGDVLFGKLRPYFHKVGIAPVDGVCSTDIVVLTARMPELSAFLLACVSSPEFVSYTNQTSTGTKMPRTSWRSMSRYELWPPAEPIAEAFQRVAGPMIARIVANIHESRTLGALRSALLPKLVVGKLRVRDAERLVGAIA